MRNGTVRSCKHQTDGSSSNVSMESRELVRRSGGSDLKINVQPPTPISTTPELGIWGDFDRSDDSGGKEQVGGAEERADEPLRREPVPAILRPGVRAKKSVADDESRPATLENHNTVPANLRPGARSKKTLVGHESQSPTSKRQESVPTNLRPGIQFENPVVRHESRSKIPRKQDSVSIMLRPDIQSKIPVIRHETSALTPKKPVSVPTVLRPAMNPKHTVVGQGNRDVSLKRRGSTRVPVILRPGYGANRGAQIIELNGETMRPGTSLAPKDKSPHAVNAKDGVDLSFSASRAGRENRQYEKLATEAILNLDESHRIDPIICNSDAVMQDWREWSERWEMSLTGTTRVENDSVDKAIQESESLLQEWRGWSERWEQSVRTI